MNKLVTTELKTVCTKVPKDQDVSELISSMKEVMKLYGGIGLAANQIGSILRVILLKTGNGIEVFINPVIEKKYGGTKTSKEGCLSFIGKQALVVRHSQVVITGFDEEWNPIKRKFKKLTAVCAQHEVDHLNGITI